MPGRHANAQVILMAQDAEGVQARLEEEMKRLRAALVSATAARDSAVHDAEQRDAVHAAALRQLEAKVRTFLVSPALLYYLWL